MSFTELKEKVAALSTKKRTELVAFIVALDDEDEAGYRDKITRRMKAMDAGKKVTEEELLRMHRKLCAQGR